MGDIQKRGRPTIYSPEIAENICERLSKGESLRTICESKGMPHEATVRSWALDDVSGFSTQYARARDIGYDRMAEEIIEISDNTEVGVKTKTNEKGETETYEGDMIEHRRLKVDSRKWILSRVLPKKYGEKIENTGSPQVAIQVNNGSLDPATAQAVRLWAQRYAEVEGTSGNPEPILLGNEAHQEGGQPPV